jgi:hypothetical protein
MEDFKTKILICVDCKEEFAFTVGAQQYFYEKGLTEDPKRCRSCYSEYKQNGRRTSNGHGRPVEYESPLDVDMDDPGFKYPGHDDDGDGTADSALTPKS